MESMSVLKGSLNRSVKKIMGETTARWHESCSENRRGTAKGDSQEADHQGLGWATASTTLLSLKSLCGGGVPSSHPCLWVVCFLSFFLFKGKTQRSAVRTLA